MNSLGIGGAYFRQVFFKPCFNKYADEEVGGVFIHITDVERLKPFATGIAIVKSLHDLYKDRVAFLKDIYEFNSLHPAFDLLCGSSSIREMILNGSEMSEIIGSWRGDEDDFSAIKREYHLYEY